MVMDLLNALGKIPQFLLELLNGMGGEVAHKGTDTVVMRRVLTFLGIECSSINLQKR